MTECSQQTAEEVITNLQKLIHQISIENHEEKLLKKILAEYDWAGIEDITLTECHVIGCIEDNHLVNGVGIAQKMNISKGGISKITARLLRRKVIQAHRLEENKKEIFYTLAPLGKKVFQIHEALHARSQAQLQLCLSGYGDSELRCINDFLERVSVVL